jgi:hypothetical protein
MRKAILTRQQSGDQGTFGTLLTDSGYQCVTGELPWRDNMANRSCIPTGTYTVNWRLSPIHGMCYHVDGVPNRTDIEIHSANFMGDTSAGYRCQLEGCIAPGKKLVDGYAVVSDNQTMVFQSVLALEELIDDMQKESFQLEINWGN